MLIIFGGSFNPPTLAHKELIDKIKLKYITLISLNSYLYIYFNLIFDINNFEKQNF